MTLATKAGLTALIGLVDNILMIQGTVNRGVPESFPAAISAYVAVGLPTVERWAAGGMVHVKNLYFVGFGYAIGGAEETAEDNLADTIDAFIRAVEADPSVGGVFKQILWVAQGQAVPEYQPVVGQEHRVVQFVLEGQQDETIPRS